MNSKPRQLAIVTGASTGIGRELAKKCARHRYDLVIAADEPEIEDAAEELRRLGAEVVAVEADLSTEEGVDKLYSAARHLGRPIDALLANAGCGLGGGFLDQEPEGFRRIVDTNITGTLLLVHKAGRDMRSRGKGKILITGSVAGFIPGSFNSVYNATKAFIDSFSAALRNELKDTGVTVTCLMPGATETAFFERAGMLDTKLGTQKKDDPAEVAADGFAAMQNGDAEVVSGWYNKIQTALAHVTPASVLAEQHRRMAEPGSASS